MGKKTEITDEMIEGATAAIQARLEYSSPWLAEVLARAAFEGAGLLPADADEGTEQAPSHVDRAG